ncbi:amidohydrolase, partial [Sutterella massiliensis]|nr:amidohydrolase [Sutterella massiliensis]
IAKGISFIDNVSTRDDITGSEDCTWLCREVRSHGGKAGFYIFGCNEHGHHRGDFCIQDEQSLPEAFEMDRRFVLMKNGLQTTPVV